jgi:hypothetical protein
MNDLRLQNGFDLMNNTIFNNNKVPNHIKNTTSNTLKLIKTSLNSSDIDKKNLVDNIDYIFNVFARYTDLSSSELNSEEKLYVMYAFRDIIDDVNLKMYEIVNKRNAASHHHPVPMVQISLAIAHYVFSSFYNIGIFGQIVNENPEIPDVSEEKIINAISFFRSSVEKNNKFESLEKELIEQLDEQKEISDDFFSKIGSFFKSEKEKEEEKKPDPKIFTAIQKQMSKRHVQKENSLKRIASYFDVQRDIVNPIHHYFRKSEEQIIANFTKAYSPEFLFKGKTFQQSIQSLIVEPSEGKSALAEVVEEVGADFVENYRKRLAENLDLILDEKNLTRLTVHMNMQIATMLSALKTRDKQESTEAFIKRLDLSSTGQTPLSNLIEFKEMMRDSILQSLAKLCIIEQKEAESDEILSNVLGSVKNKLTILGNASTEGVLKIILKKCITAEDLNDLLKKIPALKKDNEILNCLGLESQVDTINTNLDVILLFLIYSLCTGMEDIASEARQAERQGLPIDVSGLISKEEAIDELKESLSVVALAIEHLGTFNQLENRTVDSSIINNSAISLLIYFLEFQGGGGLSDIATPVHKSLFKKWQQWLSH